LEIVSGYVEQFTEPGLEQKYTASAAPLPGYSATSILIKRSVINAIGLFHEDSGTAEMVSWFAGIIDQKQKIMILPDVVVRRRIHGKNSWLLKPKEMNRAVIHILKRSIDRKRATGS
jgi:hypothetical protein